MFASCFRLVGLCLGVAALLLTAEAPLRGASFDPFDEYRTDSSQASVTHIGLDPSRNPIAMPESSLKKRGELDISKVSIQILGVNPYLSQREAMRIGAAVIRNSEKYEIDPELVLAVILVESTARPWARSPKGARGLMQVMPHMAKPLRLAGHLNTIESNIEAGCIILAENIRRLGEEDGISAYFWGQDIRGGEYFSRIERARLQVRNFHF